MRFSNAVSSPALRGLFFLCGCAWVSTAGAEQIYQTPEAFLQATFTHVPSPQLLWLTGERRETVSRILDHPPAAARLRYWREGPRSAWVLDEIGKTEPITVGVVVNAGAVEKVQVLVFRESRGWEIRYPFFTDQFQNARLTEGERLNRGIDGISGATLSVRAVEKLARLALYLHGQSAAASHAETP